MVYWIVVEYDLIKVISCTYSWILCWTMSASDQAIMAGHSPCAVSPMLTPGRRRWIPASCRSDCGETISTTRRHASGTRPEAKGL